MNIQIQIIDEIILKVIVRNWRIFQTLSTVIPKLKDCYRGDVTFHPQ